MAERSFSYKPLPIEPEIVEIGHGEIWSKIPKANLIISSEFYAKNVSKIGLKFDIPDITDRNILDIVIEIINLNSIDIPEEKWQIIRNILLKLECNDILKNLDNQIEKILNERAKLMEEKQRETENPTISVFFKLNTGANVIVKHLKASMLISEAKKLISAVTNMKPDSILFQIKDTLLPDEKTLSQCGLTNNSIITFFYDTPEYREALRRKQQMQQAAAARAAPRPPPRPPVQNTRVQPQLNPVQNQNYNIPQRNMAVGAQYLPNIQNRAPMAPKPPVTNQDMVMQQLRATEAMTPALLERLAHNPQLLMQYYQRIRNNLTNQEQIRQRQQMTAPTTPAKPPPPKPVQTPPQPKIEPPKPKTKEEIEAERRKLLENIQETTTPLMEPADKSQLIVILPNLKKVGVKLKSTALKIEKLKEAVCKNTAYAPEKHKLVYERVTMLDTMKLSDYKLAGRAPVYLLPK
ncbi:Ubiquitin family protein [Trichomonas vaginalis G3]|uniref:Ubiquitin family protein n=1 Tax=Trichomonas vaginalis (strain ATCC PRA-98 / G3) TaxID=412133 RepID=A2F8B2_TRIV3|nr:ubiquitin-like domain family [Trichomonas vaginalis G3]EAX98872.1 Ubiquitin family protein [Trichomonas vaginalis G3]KAI5540550.1 ubiquitin-like domain family [Trichomonas vaginalis G3]|eukprot:XP_001311802.1 Ubiquitin family protein [Trichomonas vaginalis G3]